MPALQDAWQNRMSLPSGATDAAVTKAFAEIPALLEQSPALIARGRLLDCDCLLGLAAHPFHASIRAGRIVDLTPAPVLMRSWRFAYRATSAAWTEYWRPMPKPGWHDLLPLTQRVAALPEYDNCAPEGNAIPATHPARPISIAGASG